MWWKKLSDIICPSCCGRGYGLDGNGNYAYSTGKCMRCNGVGKLENICTQCKKPITHNEGYLTCSIKCQMESMKGLVVY